MKLIFPLPSSDTSPFKLREEHSLVGMPTLKASFGGSSLNSPGFAPTAGLLRSQRMRAVAFGNSAKATMVPTPKVFKIFAVDKSLIDEADMLKALSQSGPLFQFISEVSSVDPAFEEAAQKLATLMAQKPELKQKIKAVVAHGIHNAPKAILVEDNNQKINLNESLKMINEVLKLPNNDFQLAILHLLINVSVEMSLMAAVNPRGGIVYEESRDKDGYNGILLLDSYETKFPQSTHLDALKQVAMMHQIQVRPDARGFGTGTRLVQKALTEARQNGFKYALMASDSRDPGLNRFVEKQGFQKADANLPAPVQRVLDEMRVLENPDSLAAALKNPHEIYYWRRV